MRDITDHPQSLEAWLNYINAQDSIHFAKPLQRISKKLDIVESAQKKLPDNEQL